MADELKTHSIVLRASAKEQEPNALIWVPKKSGTKRRKDLSYLKVLFVAIFVLLLRCGSEPFTLPACAGGREAPL
jgi:hypothetical protein